MYLGRNIEIDVNESSISGRVDYNEFCKVDIDSSDVDVDPLIRSVCNDNDNDSFGISMTSSAMDVSNGDKTVAETIIRSANRKRATTNVETVQSAITTTITKTTTTDPCSTLFITPCRTFHQFAQMLFFYEILSRGEKNEMLHRLGESLSKIELRMCGNKIGKFHNRDLFWFYVYVINENPDRVKQRLIRRIDDVTNISRYLLQKMVDRFMLNTLESVPFLYRRHVRVVVS